MVENCKYCWQNCPNAGQEGKDETDICENYWGPWGDSTIIPAEQSGKEV